MSKNEKSNVTMLGNAYTKKKLAQEQYNRKQEIFRRRRLAVIFLVAMLVFTYPSIRIYQAYNELVATRENKQTAIANSEDLSKVQKQLEKEVKLLQDDDYVAKVARSKYFLSKDGEQLYSVPEQVGNKENTQINGNKTTSSSK
ncbi:MAG: septum formation initiator family protein [Lactobacillales bacterium]|nr:septum formation initiator family protein [Lactobacillales bacterium]